MAYSNVCHGGNRNFTCINVQVGWGEGKRARLFLIMASRQGRNKLKPPVVMSQITSIHVYFNNTNPPSPPPPPDCDFYRVLDFFPVKNFVHRSNLDSFSGKLYKQQIYIKNMFCAPKCFNYISYIVQSLYVAFYVVPLTRFI